MTAAFTGLRASELRGLRWEDIDLAKSEINVRQRLDFRNSAGPPKSGVGRRKIPLPPIVANTLREWKLICPRNGGRLDLVFPTETGRAQHHANIVQRGLQPAWIKAGVIKVDGSAKYPGLHALRHFYASWLINRREEGGLGLPVKIVAARLGHSTTALTLNLYAHLFDEPDAQAEIAEAERALLG